MKPIVYPVYLFLAAAAVWLLVRLRRRAPYARVSLAVCAATTAVFLLAVSEPKH